MTAKLTFTVGGQTVTSLFRIDHLLNDPHLLEHFFVNELVPAYLHCEISSCFNTLLHDVANSRDEADDELRSLAYCFEKGHELAYKISRTHKYASTNLTDDSNSEESAFIAAYENVMKSTQAAKEIGQLEASYAAALAELLSSKNSALSNLHNRQSREMEQLISRGDADVAGVGAGAGGVEKLVAKHVGEVAALERRWDVELSDLKRNQRRDYRADVIELYAEIQRRRSGAAAADTRPLLSNRLSSSSVHRSAASQQQLSDTTTTQQQTSPTNASGGAVSDVAAASTALANSVRRSAMSLLKFGRRESKQTPSPQKDAGSKGNDSDSMNLASSPGAGGIGGSGGNVGGTTTVVSNGGMASAGTTAMAASPTTATPLSSALNNANAINNSTEMYRIVLGSQMKQAYDVAVTSGDILDVIRSSSSSTNAPIYSDALPALLLLVDPGIKFSSKQCQEFAVLCNASTEFHFASLEEQLEQVRADVLLHGALKPGEFFITRHSTLSGVRVVFHMVTGGGGGGEEGALDAKAAVLRGLRNVLAVAAQYDVTSLALPVLLVDRGAEMMMNDSVALKRAQTILFTVKSSLQQHCFGDNPLRLIRFVAPARSDAITKKFRELLG